MPDSRLAQLIMPASIIDDRPDIIVGTMSGMIVMQAKRIHDGGQMGIHYVVWHQNLPTMPIRAVVPGENPLDFIPWINVECNNDPANPESGRWRYEWTDTKTKRIVLKGEYTLVPPETANENGKAIQ